MGKHEPAEVRREQILLAAMHVCGDKGYHATRIDDIAARAGLSKGAIYHHFDSKQEIFLSLLEMLLDESSAQMASLDAGGAGLADTIHQVYDTQLKLLGDRPQLMRGLFDFYLLAARDPEFRDRLHRHYQALLDTGTALLRHAAERGELAADVDPQRAARVLLMGGDGLMLMHHLVGEADDGFDAAVYFTDLLLAALTRETKP